MCLIGSYVNTGMPQYFVNDDRGKFAINDFEGKHQVAIDVQVADRITNTG